MMSLRFGQFSDPVYERQSRTEVRELVSARQMMFIDDRPLRSLGKLRMKIRQFLSFERRDSTAAGNAIFFGKRRHGVTSITGYDNRRFQFAEYIHMYILKYRGPLWLESK